ncbi:hypothetical protein H5410_004790 [Solanum commersonii]|uniref:Uncharacterized protein n=1 Tax=Solanum commersonii TaxID=4109 RepID=A0A9J6A5U2_SOLCO|nr:hypothetical protein H5410_004790 [Solanum commersonii]
MNKDPKKKSLCIQELLDLIERRIQQYYPIPQKGIIQDNSVRHITKKIPIQEGDKDEMFNNYLKEVRRNLLLNITQYEKSYTSKRKPIFTRDSSFDDLKNEIKSLKQNQMICDQIEIVHNKGKNIDEDNTLAKPFNLDPRQGMLVGMIQIVTAHIWYLDPPIILGAPFINAIYLFTSINAKGLSATYEDRDISYTFITDPVSRDINDLINMKQKHVDSLQPELFIMNVFDTLKSTKVQEKNELISEQIIVDICADHPNYLIKIDAQSVKYMFNKDFKHDASKLIFARWQAQLAPFDFEIHYKKGRWTLLGWPRLEAGEIIEEEDDHPQDHQDHLDDVPGIYPLYAQLQEYLSQKQGDNFASIAKEEADDIKYYEKHFSGYNTSENVYNFSKMIIKQVISVDDWGKSTMKERQISLNKVSMNFTYWDYIHAFDKVFIYNNERHKHTWFIKVYAKIFAEPIPNWFLNLWSYRGPTIKSLPYPFLKLYKE